MNVWTAPFDAVVDATPLTRLPGRPPIWHDWSADSRFVFFLKDENGDENFCLFAVDALSAEVQNLTPWLSTRARTSTWRSGISGLLSPRPSAPCT
jgi:hypothetical protein